MFTSATVLVKRWISMLQSRNAANRKVMHPCPKERISNYGLQWFLIPEILPNSSSVCRCEQCPASPAAVQLCSVRKHEASFLGSWIPCDCPHPAHLQAGVSSLCSCYKAAPLLFLQRRTKALEEDKKKEGKKKASPSQEAEHYRYTNFLLLYIWCSSYLDTTE